MKTASDDSRGGGSQPDLRNLQLFESEGQQVTLRSKRKQPHDDFASRFDMFEQRVMSMISRLAESQTEKLNTISQDVSLIRDHISQIKTTTDQLAAEQVLLKEEISKVAAFKASTELKIKAIEDEIQALQTTAGTSRCENLNFDNMLSELHERSQRARNLIIIGIDEIRSTNIEERRNHDTAEVNKVLQLAVPDPVQPTRLIRLGKYTDGKSRPLKACFETPGEAKTILRNKSAINREISSVRIYSDETPWQKKNMQQLRKNLKRRTEAGEKDLTIKFLQGMPKIVVQTLPKNSNLQ